jgi:hypothetical protein
MQTTFDVIFLFVILIKPNNFTYSAPKFVVLNYYLNQFSWFEIYSKPHDTMTIFFRSQGLGNPIMTLTKETPLPFRKITDYWARTAQITILQNCKYKLNLPGKE